MCIIVLQPKGKRITKTEFDEFAQRNPDGFGLMFINDDTNKLEMYKTMDKKDFWEKYTTVCNLRGDKTPIVLHYRFGTSGKKNVENCHPFYVTETIGFAHNGIISGLGNETYNDSYVFNEKVLKNLGENILTNKATQDLVCNYIGAFNKLVFLTAKKDYFIFNEDAGEWRNGIWYSAKEWKNHTSNSGIKHVVNHSKCNLCGGPLFEKEYIYLWGDDFKSHYVCFECASLDPTISEIMTGKLNPDRQMPTIPK